MADVLFSLPSSGLLWAATRICPLVANRDCPDMATTITLREEQQ